MIVTLIFSVSTSTLKAQTVSADTSKVDVPKTAIEVSLIRAANKIFLEHQNYQNRLLYYQSIVENQDLMLIEKEKINDALLRSNTAQADMIEIQKRLIDSQGKYTEQQIKKVKKSRNKAYVITGLSLLLSGFLLAQ